MPHLRFKEPAASSLVTEIILENQRKEWWAMRDLNPRHLRCERSVTAPNPNELANCALLAQALSVVSTKKPGSAKFNEPMRTSLAPSQTLCGRSA